VCWCLAFVIDKPLTPKPKVLGPQPFLISGFSNNVVFLFLYSTFVIAETPINLFFLHLVLELPIYHVEHPVSFSFQRRQFLLVPNFTFLFLCVKVYLISVNFYKWLCLVVVLLRFRFLF
jgi:hypothetical protein